MVDGQDNHRCIDWKYFSGGVSLVTSIGSIKGNTGYPILGSIKDTTMDPTIGAIKGSTRDPTVERIKGSTKGPTIGGITTAFWALGMRKITACYIYG